MNILLSDMLPTVSLRSTFLALEGSLIVISFYIYAILP